jgi:tRNA(fMet)-specific endonuclease VapC
VKYLLDSNTCIQVLRQGNASPVMSHLAGLAPADVVLCWIVVGELLYGALRSQNVAKSLAQTRRFLSQFLALPFDGPSAEEYARLRADLMRKGTPIGANDMLIAASALANGLTLVTHNTNEFSRVVGLALEDWQVP